MRTVKELREHFNGSVAPELAKGIRATQPLIGKRSKRFAYFADDDDRFVIVAGGQEQDDVDKALAYGLAYRRDRPLVLVLPQQWAFPTLQRAPWLNAEAQPVIYLHDDEVILGSASLEGRQQTIDRVRHVRPGKTPAAELREAATPVHLGDVSPDVGDLVEWATKHPLLDPAHRQGERAWHCMGQKVLSIRAGSQAPTIRGGIHTTKSGKPAFEDEEGTARAVTGPGAAVTLVKEGIGQRLSGPYRRADEHWLQAVIRDDPALVGVEQPALREVPAWRPAAKPPDHPEAWGRGFVDLAGLDGHGNLRIVETKLAANKDELLIFQGLDYYIWARAYREPLLDRLGGPSKRTRIVLHYVIGDDPGTRAIKLSQFAPAQAAALTDDPGTPEKDRFLWRIQTVHHWFRPDKLLRRRHPDEPEGLDDPDEQAAVYGRLWPEGALPG